MSWQKFSSYAAILALATAHCTSAIDPGTDVRYSVDLASPAEVAGKIFHWPSMPVKLRYNACNVSNCSNAIESAVLRGISFWQKNASLYGEVQTTYAEPADVVVQYVAALSGSTIGVCSASLAQNTRTKQILVLTPISLTIATTANGRALASQDVEYVAAHEMGHCLGMWNHSPTNGDLMYAFLTSKTSYSGRDVNSLRYLYSKGSDLATFPASAVGQVQEYQIVGEIASTPLIIP